MNKNQKVLLGVAVVGVAGYFYWKSKQPKAAFAKAGLAGSDWKNGDGDSTFLAGKVKHIAKAGGKVYGKGGQFLAGAAQPLGSNSGTFKQFTANKAQDATFAPFARASADGVKSIPTEKVAAKASANGFYSVKDSSWM